MTSLLLRLFAKDALANPSALENRARVGTLGSVTGVAVNLLLSLVKFGVGLATGALSVMADAVNNLSDALSALVSLVTVRVARKPRDDAHPFGHGRAEYLGTLFVGALILAMGISLLVESVRGIASPAPVTASALAFVLLGLSVCAKLWLFFCFRKLSRLIASDLLLAAAKDSLGDVLATGAALLSLLFTRLFGVHVDGWAGLVVSAFVLYNGFAVCRDTANDLLGRKPDKAVYDALIAKLKSYPGILGVHDVIIHDYGPGRQIASVHAEVSVHADIVRIHEIIDEAERAISAETGMVVCVHTDPIVTDDAETVRLKGEMEAFLAARDGRLRLHDFRVVPGESRVNVVFDVVVPDGTDTASLACALEAFAASLGARYRLVLRFDTALYGPEG